ncbi:hypothetical protein BH10PAT3_BH10PAT3_7220 [soil metagenome]
MYKYLPIRSSIICWARANGIRPRTVRESELGCKITQDGEAMDLEFLGKKQEHRSVAGPVVTRMFVCRSLGIEVGEIVALPEAEPPVASVYRHYPPGENFKKEFSTANQAWLAVGNERSAGKLVLESLVPKPVSRPRVRK